MKKTILIVDDSPEDITLFKRFLQGGDADESVLISAETGEEALELYKKNALDLIIIDYNLPDYNGVELLSCLPRKNDRPAVPAIMMTGQGNESVAVKAMKKGAKDYLVKGNFSAENLKKTILNVLKEDAIEKKLDESRAFLDTLVKTSPNPIFYKDKMGALQGCNPAFEKMFGMDESDIIGKTAAEITDKQLAAKAREIDRILLRNGGTQEYDFTFTDTIGNQRTLIFNKSAFHDNTGRISGVLGVITEITERKKYEEKIYKLAMFDQLTGLANRLYFYQRLKNARMRAHRTAKMLAVLYLDLDGFKKINDTCGHACGDIVLAETAKRIKACLRETDTPARVGGDEFLIILENLKKEQDVGPVAEKLIHALKQPIDINGEHTAITASIGIAFYSKKTPLTTDELVLRADKAMYQSKSSGRNRYTLSKSPEENHG